MQEQTKQCLTPTIVHTRPNLITKSHPQKHTITALPDFDEKVCSDKTHQMITRPNLKEISEHTLITRERKKILHHNEENSKSMSIEMSPFPKWKQVKSPLNTGILPKFSKAKKCNYPKKEQNGKSILEKLEEELLKSKGTTEGHLLSKKYIVKLQQKVSHNYYITP